MRKNFNHQIGEYHVLEKWSDMEYYHTNGGNLVLHPSPVAHNPMRRFINELNYILCYNKMSDPGVIRELYQDLNGLYGQFIKINEEGIENE